MTSKTVVIVTSVLVAVLIYSAEASPVAKGPSTASMHWSDVGISYRTYSWSKFRRLKKELLECQQEIVRISGHLKSAKVIVQYCSTALQDCCSLLEKSGHICDHRLDEQDEINKLRLDSLDLEPISRTVENEEANFEPLKLLLRQKREQLSVLQKALGLYIDASVNCHDKSFDCDIRSLVVHPRGSF